ncbi:hypothetical protein [Paracoccus sp. (in: a-proteobacteria)]|nr:hypothetical protein [Paracoccus sp. (in: a-proteobacteria)]
MPVRKARVLGLGVYDEVRQAGLQSQDWQDIRTRINHARPEPLAFCLGCNEPAHVKAATSTERSPHFAHYKGGGLSCPWGEDGGRNPDDVRASIYAGNQESPLHKSMCNQVLELISLDPRYELGSGVVDGYLPPNGAGRGRWPDVRFNLDGLGKFAVEVQLAPSLATEVVARSKYYLSQGIHLIWLVPWYTFDRVARAFTADIAQEAGGNLFVLDDSAVAASLERQTLCLWAAWQADTGMERRLISLDDLEYRSDRHPLLKDVATPAVFREASLRRESLIGELIRTKSNWSSAILHPVTGERDSDFDRLLRVMFSIWAEADGRWANFLNKQENITGLLNAYLNSQDGQCRAQIINDMLTRTRAFGQIRATVWNKMRDALRNPQLSVVDPTISEAMSYFPEVYRADLRGDPIRTDILPDWAT